MSSDLAGERVIRVFEGLVTQFEQRGAVFAGKAQHLLSQGARAHIECPRRLAEFFIEQVFDLAFVEAVQQGFQQIAFDQFVQADLRHRQAFIDRRGPGGIPSLIDQLQAFVCWPAVLLAEQLQLRQWIGPRVLIGLVAGQLIEQLPQVEVDPKAPDAVGQQRRQGLLIDVHLAQPVFGVATDLENPLALGRGKRLDAVAKAPQRGIGVPLQGLLEFGVPRALAVVAQ
ncbi:hypothetical protein D3C73_731690 [compost metagenome]